MEIDSVVELTNSDFPLQAVDATLVKEVCSKYIYDRCPVVAAVGPTENLPDYNTLRDHMVWYRM